MKRAIILWFLLLLVVPFVFAAPINDSLHLNIQVVNSQDVPAPGTYDFVFNISSTSGCSNSLYSNSATLATSDFRAVLNHTLEEIGINFTDQYYLRYERNGTLISCTEINRAPYSFTSKNITTSGISADSNLSMGNFDVIANRFYGLLNWILDPIASIYFSFNGTTLTLDQGALNGTIDNRINITVDGNNVSWTATFNSSYDEFAYNQTEAGDIRFLNLSGTNANQNINISPYNLETNQISVFSSLNDKIILSGSQADPWHTILLKNSKGLRFYDDDSATGIFILSSNGSLNVTGNLGINRSLTVDGDTFFVDDVNNRVGIGTTTPVAPLEIQSLAASMRQTRYSDTDVQSAGLTVQRSRGTTIGTDVIVQDGDRIANFNLRGYDGAAYRTAASIQAFIDGTPGGGDMPGRLTFLTTLDGASSATERMRITNDGLIGIGTVSPTHTLNIVGDANITGDLIVGDSINITDRGVNFPDGVNATFGDGNDFIIGSDGTRGRTYGDLILGNSFASDQIGLFGTVPSIIQGAIYSNITSTSANPKTFMKVIFDYNPAIGSGTITVLDFEVINRATTTVNTIFGRATVASPGTKAASAFVGDAKIWDNIDISSGTYNLRGFEFQPRGYTGTITGGDVVFAGLYVGARPDGYDGADSITYYSHYAVEGDIFNNGTLNNTGNAEFGKNLSVNGRIFNTGLMLLESVNDTNQVFTGDTANVSGLNISDLTGIGSVKYEAWGFIVGSANFQWNVTVNDCDGVELDDVFVRGSAGIGQQESIAYYITGYDTTPATCTQGYHLNFDEIAGAASAYVKFAQLTRIMA